MDLNTGERIDQLSDESDADTNEVVTCFCMHPNGDEVVVSTQNFLLRHWKISEKTCLRVIKGHSMPVLSMAYDPTGNLTDPQHKNKVGLFLSHKVLRFPE